MKAYRATVSILLDPRLVKSEDDAETAIQSLLGGEYLVLDWAYLDGDEDVVAIEIGNPEDYQKGRSV